ncbi:MAG: UvrD-helicase domain-containing protein [Acidimicrobiales bacterium]
MTPPPAVVAAPAMAGEEAVSGDEAARRLVSSEGLGRTLFVEAGAGAGKTTQLVERIANLVLREGVRLANVAAITFTEAAAAELAGRVRVRFERQAADAASETERALCVQAVADADLAAITTLHGFANRLLGEFALAAGLPPRVHVLDEVASQLAHEARWRRFVDELYDDPDNAELLGRARLVGVALEPAYQGHATLKDVAVELTQNWDRLGPLAREANRPLEPVCFAPFDSAVAALALLPGQCADPADLFCTRLVTQLLPELTPVAGLADPDRKLRALSAVGPWRPGQGGLAANWGNVKAAKAHVEDVNEARTGVLAAAADDVLRRLLGRIAQHVLTAAAQRRAEGGLEFHDLLVLARDLLRSDPAVRAALHARYTHLLLDEFQDTDPLQIELAALIAAEPGQPAGAWSELAIPPGRLFFVGDPKQSIYRFRRADIGLFLAARDRFGAQGSRAQLTTNFRTVGPILDWVNALFSEEMAQERPGLQPAYEPLVAWRSPSPTGDHRPVLLGGPHPDPKVKAGELREAEAASVAAVLADIRRRPEAWPVFDHAAGRWRPAAPRDVAVLVPTRTSLPYLRRALDGQDLPYRLAAGTLVYDTQEVRDLLAVLRAVDDPTDELSLVAALRSPLYACSDVDLHAFRQAGGQWDLRVAPPAGLAADQPVGLALAHLHSLWRERWWLSPSVLVERVLRERRAFLLGFGERRPAEVWRRLRFLHDQALAFEAAGGGGLRGFVDWAALQGADSARVHEPLLPERDDDAAQVLTVHGAKGLEFPIVVLSGMTTQPGSGRRGVSVLWPESGPPEVKLRAELATANHEPRADLELEMDEHEKLRLLYVAVTRARDHLVVACHHQVSGRGERTYAGRVWRRFEADRGSWRPAPAPDSAAEPLGAAAPPVGPPAPEPARVWAERAAWSAERSVLLGARSAPAVRSATAIARQAGAAIEVDAAADAAEEDDSAERSALRPARRRGRSGAAIGRAVHAVLQAIDLADPSALEAHVRRCCALEAVAGQEAVVAAMVRSALAAPAVRAAAGRVHHKEVYVAAPVAGSVVEGYVDLLVDTPQGLEVIDYKTDAVSGPAELEAKVAAYELQGAAYAVALEAATGQAVSGVTFVFCRPAGPVERRVADLAAAMARVRAELGSAGA